MPVSHVARELGLTTSGTRALIRNRVYLGELRVGAHVNPNAHPRIVSADEWLAAQGAAPARPPRANGEVALLAGLARCASCGHVMSPGSNRKYHAYACRRNHSAGQCHSPAAITRRTLDRYVERIALAELSQLEAKPTRSEGTVDQIRAAVREAETELSAYLEGVSAAGLHPDQYVKGARMRRDEVDRQRDKLAEALTRIPQPVNGDPVKLWESLDSRRRNQLLRGLLECVLVASAGGRGKRVSIEDRVRVIAHGAGVAPRYRGGGVAMPIERISLPDRDDPVVLGMEFAEDALERAGG